MASQTRQKIITIHILLNIRRCKGNQTLKLGQLIKYNIRNKKNHTENVGEKVVADPLKISKLGIFLDQQSGLLKLCLLYVLV